MRTAWAVTLGLVSCVATPAAAQMHDTSYAEIPPSRCAFPDSEMTRVPVYVWADLPDSSSPVIRALAENLMQDVVERVPALLGGSPDSLPRGEPMVRWYDLKNALDITGYPNGRMTWQPAVGIDAGAAELLGRALAAAVAAGTKFPWDSTMAGDSLRFRFVFTWPQVDLAGRLHPIAPEHTAVPAFSIAYPITQEVQPEPGNQPPRYPADARDSRFMGSVLLQFIVDTAGRAVMSTAHDLWPKDKPRLTGEQGRIYGEFLEAVLHVLPAYRFTPAMLGRSCRTRELVRMPFVFSLSR